MLQRVATCCSVTPGIAACCSVLQRGVAWCSVVQCDTGNGSVMQCVAKRSRVATVSKNDQIIGLFCRISSLLYGSFAKETCNFVDPTNRSHLISRTKHEIHRSKHQMCCSVLQLAVCRSLLQCVAACYSVV